ncbi:HNH endonuclease [Cohnella sp. GCM10027633]|uniref:HNH endonuclease n=1 Tax=unclassified Cohnella TaxID=2636738 RepID=UPI00362BA483
MRSIIKAEKPDILVEKEIEWTQELMNYVTLNTKIPDSVKARYRHHEIKDALLTETKNKCAYCESKITHIDHGDIEHIEPKSKVPNKTFMWSNLTIGCTKCNQNKLDYFDENLPLINPYIDTPEDKIKFVGPIPFPKDGDVRADLTIRLLKLDRPELIERRIDHINLLKPLIKEYQITDNPTLRRMVLEDLLKYTKPDKEFTLMADHLLFDLAITG